MALTRRQKEVIEFIAKFVDEHGYSPSYEEIARGLNLASLATVHKHINALETKNYLKKSFNQSRSVDVAPKYLQEQRRQRGPFEVPLMGRIAAGQPLEAIETRATLSFSDFAKSSDTFALEVQGDSMIEDHICSGDMILVEKASTARDGEIVVALVNGDDATLKRFYKEPNGMVTAAAREFDDGADLRASGQPSNSGPVVGSSQKILNRGGECALLEFFFGAGPIGDRVAGLATTRFPVQISLFGNGFLGDHNFRNGFHSDFLRCSGSGMLRGRSPFRSSGLSGSGFLGWIAGDQLLRTRGDSPESGTNFRSDCLFFCH